MDGGDRTVRLGALNLKVDRGGFDSGPDVSVSSPVTRQKAAAAKQFIENHYKNYLQELQERKERENESSPSESMAPPLLQNHLEAKPQPKSPSNISNRSFFPNSPTVKLKRLKTQPPPLMKLPMPETQKSFKDEEEEGRREFSSNK
ncbi:hypothetical protein L484_009560 [Morus notabilis]|uniref:Uncharacterized protein n=1 Tax=Morus notabilis TaxID=981085 RepID=W9SA14_9ROSA|nr:hypothetical protein L484_009560 [Morus notabilis]